MMNRCVYVRRITIPLIFLPFCSVFSDWVRHEIVPSAQSIVSSVCLHDFDSDGRMDIVSSYDYGVFVHLSPDWKPTRIHTFRAGKSRNRPQAGCLHSCVMDVDGDGDVDFIGANQTLFWLENPGKIDGGKAWTYRTIDDEIFGIHCLKSYDIDRDGRLELFANSWCSHNKTSVPESIMWFDIPADPTKNEPWVRNIFADKDARGGSHYFEFGDLNGDGLIDICSAAKGGKGYPHGEWFAWWESPKNPRDLPWKKRLISDQEPGATNIIPAHMNGDEHVDLIASRGHGQGVLFFAGPQYRRTEIDAFVGPHTLLVLDVDGDGHQDVVTCSRHKEGGIMWCKNDGNGNFTRQIIGENQAAYDLRNADMDEDGDVDFVVAGQSSKNLVWYENPAK